MDIRIENSQKGRRHRAIGIDLGVKDLCVLSNGVKIAQHGSLSRLRYNLRYFEYRQKRQKRYSKNWQETQRIITKTKRDILRCQTDHANKIAHYLTRSFRVICIEGPQPDTGEGTAIHDANWDLLRDTIKKKCHERNRTYIEVRPYFSTQTCSRCGVRKKLMKETRIYECDSCGLSLDRDINAAINLKRMGLSKLQK